MTDASSPDSPALENLSHEERRFPPSPEFAAQANAGPELYEQAAADRLEFWATQARELITWATPFSQTLDWSLLIEGGNLALLRYVLDLRGKGSACRWKKCRKQSTNTGILRRHPYRFHWWMNWKKERSKRMTSS